MLFAAVPEALMKQVVVLTEEQLQSRHGRRHVPVAVLVNYLPRLLPLRPVATLLEFVPAVRRSTVKHTRTAVPMASRSAACSTIAGREHHACCSKISCWLAAWAQSTPRGKPAARVIGARDHCAQSGPCVCRHPEKRRGSFPTLFIGIIKKQIEAVTKLLSCV